MAENTVGLLHEDGIERSHEELIEELAREITSISLEFGGASIAPHHIATRAYAFLVEERGFLPPAEVDRRVADRVVPDDELARSS